MATSSDRAVLNSIFNPLLPVDAAEDNLDLSVDPDDDSDAPNVQQARQSEIEGIRLADTGDIDGAIGLFNAAVNLCPNRASGYNNRAQAFRLKGDIASALSDLNKAIELSHKKGKAACQAYTQRGLIYRLQNSDEKARSDFENAAHLGSDFARSQLVLMNPYAAMCNKMLSDVMGRLQRGEPEDSEHSDAPA